MRNKAGRRIFVCVGLAMCVLLTAEIVCAADWFMYRHDPMHTGVSEDIVEPPFEFLWKYHPDAEYDGSEEPPLYIHALDVATGEEKWKTTIGAGWSSESSPAVVGDTVYIGSRDNNIYALDATTGNVKWKYFTGGEVHSSPVVLDGVVYIGSADLHLYVLDAQTGAEKWKYKTRKDYGGIFSSPAVSDGKVYLDIYVLDTKNKEEVDGGVYQGGWCSPTICGGTVYWSNDDKKYIYAADIKTGDKKWDFEMDQDEVGGSAVAASEDIIYIASRTQEQYTEDEKGYLYALDATTGTKKWKCEIDCVMCAPTISGDIVYIGSYVLDADTGDEKDKFNDDLANSYDAETIIAGGNLYRSTGGVAVVGDTVYAVGDVYAYTSPNAVIAPSTSYQSTSTQQSTTKPDDNTPTTTEDAQEKNSTNYLLIAAPLLLIAIAIFAISKRKKQIPAPHSAQGTINIKREYTVLPNNDLNLEITAANDTGYAVMDVKSILDHPPTLFSMKGSKVQSIGNLSPAESKTASYILKPLGCIHNEVLDAIITYQDHTGEKQTLHMQPLEVHCVCPFLKGKAMTSGEFARLAGESESIEEGISFSGISVLDVSDILRKICVPRLHVIGEHEVDDTMVMYLSGESIGEKACYLLTAVVQPYKDKDVTRIAFRAYSDKPYGLHGFLNEIVESMRHLISSVQSAREIGIIESKQVVNIIDSVVQRTSFGGVGQGANTEVNIEGSVMHRSDLDGGDRDSREAL
ncbi:MAG: PQQ-binding-like beta-propeller repeat protein [Nitrospiraceae bacterium]|nr:PQQ-binding-like beta-propeller repeat protein [Nitrospiraceae bacterium]